MKFIFFIGGFLLFLQPNLIGAEVSIPSLSHTKKLEKILELDSILMTKIRRIQRNNLFEGVVKDMEILRSTWNLRPTVDVTLRYTPYLQKYSLSCEIAALAMVLHSL